MPEDEARAAVARVQGRGQPHAIVSRVRRIQISRRFGVRREMEEAMLARVQVRSFRQENVLHVQLPQLQRAVPWSYQEQKDNLSEA